MPEPTFVAWEKASEGRAAHWAGFAMGQIHRDMDAVRVQVILLDAFLKMLREEREATVAALGPWLTPHETPVGAINNLRQSEQANRELVGELMRRFPEVRKMLEGTDA